MVARYLKWTDTTVTVVVVPIFLNTREENESDGMPTT